MNLPLSREELDKIGNSLYRTRYTDLIRQASLAIELKEALEWVFKRGFILTDNGGLYNLHNDFRIISSASTPLEAIQNARKKDAQTDEKHPTAETGKQSQKNLII